MHKIENFPAAFMQLCTNFVRKKIQIFIWRIESNNNMGRFRLLAIKMADMCGFRRLSMAGFLKNIGCE
jgi:hypothetical protein